MNSPNFITRKEKTRLSVSLLATNSTYDFIIGELALLYQGIVEVSMNKIALWIVSVQMIFLERHNQSEKNIQRMSFS